MREFQDPKTMHDAHIDNSLQYHKRLRNNAWQEYQKHKDRCSQVLSEKMRRQHERGQLQSSEIPLRPAKPTIHLDLEAKLNSAEIGIKELHYKIDQLAFQFNTTRKALLQNQNVTDQALESLRKKIQARTRKTKTKKKVSPKRG